MNAEDALSAIGQGNAQKKRRSTWDEQKGRNRERSSPLSSHDTIKRRDNKSPRMVKFTPLVMPVDKILMQIKDDHALKWPKLLHFLPIIRIKKKYCRFHKDWSLHRGLQGFKKADRGTDPKMEATKICEKGCARTT